MSIAETPSAGADLLDRVFRPRSVAVVGASPKGTFGGRAIRYLRKYAFSGPVFGVNPSYDEVQGWPCVPTIEALPAHVDAAVVAVARDRVVDAIKDLGKRGCRLAVVQTVGFEETGAEGAALQQEMVDAARAAGMRIVGPNTTGLLNVRDRIPLGSTTAMERSELRAGSTALISQSGSVGGALLDMGMEAGIGFSYAVFVGNAADLGPEELLATFADDPHTSTVMMLCEGTRHPQAFAESLGRLSAAGKRAVILKVGRTAAVESLVTSHSGTLAGSWKTFKAVAEARGAIVVESLEELLAVALTHGAGSKHAAPGRRIEVFSSSGALCGLMSDACVHEGLSLAEPSAETVERLKALGCLPPYNPLDFSRAARPEANRIKDYHDVLTALVTDAETDAVLVGAGVSHTMVQHVDALIDAHKLGDSLGKPLLVYSTSGELGVEIRRRLAEAGVRAYRDLGLAMRSVARLSDTPPAAPSPPAAAPPDPATAQAYRAMLASPTESSTKRWLSHFGVPVTHDEIVATPEEAADAAESAGFPVVLKLSTPTGIHKSRMGLVRLGLGDRAAVASAFADIRQRAAAAGVWSGACMLSREEELRGGQEMLIGVNRDSVFGPVIVIGAGGVLTEVWDDAAVLPDPLSEELVRRALAGLKVGKVLDGALGRTLDRDGFVATVLAVARAMRAMGPEVESIDLNPVWVGPTRCIALDARVVLVS